MLAFSLRPIGWRKSMKIADVMTRDVEVVSPTSSVREAARQMDRLNVGVLPVCDGKRLVGIITDRDITVRVSAAGEDADKTRVQEVMSQHVRWCMEDDPVEEAEKLMTEAQIRRLPVLDSDQMLVGIVSLGDLAEDGAPGVEEALRRISEPAEPDRSGTPSTRSAGGQPRVRASNGSDDDHRLRSAMREAFAANPDLDDSSIHIAVYEGLVRLTGTVGSEEDLRRAEEAARSVTGVKELRNELTVHQEVTTANQTGDVRTGSEGRQRPNPHGLASED
jgi:CBS domain-containing protein